MEKDDWKPTKKIIDFMKKFGPKKLQYWLGHEDISVTLNIYSHFNKQRLNTCSADLNEISNAVAELF